MSAGRAIGVVGVWVVLGLATSAAAQTLGEVAKKEEARRKGVAGAGKVYTNDALRPEPAPAVPAPATPAGSGDAGAKPPAADSAAGGKAAEPAGKPDADVKKDEGYWRKRVQAERDALGRAETFLIALQSRINALSTDFVNRDDPAQRNVIAADREKALAELDRVKKEIEDHTKAIADIQEEARRAGVPAAWVR